MPTNKQGFRFLVWTLVTAQSNPLGDSGFFVALSLAKKLAEEGNYVYMVLPSQFKEPIRTGELAKIPRIKFITTDISSILHAQYYSLTDTMLLNDLFSLHEGKYFFDAAVVFSGEHALQMRSVLSHKVKGMSDYPIYYIELGINSPDTNPAFQGMTATEHLQSFGVTVSTPVMLSKRETSVMVDKMLMCGIGASQRESAKDRTIEASIPLEFEELDEYAAKATRDESKKPTLGLLYAARINSVKRVEKIVPAFDKLYRQGVKCDVKLLTNTPQMKGDRFLGTNKVIEEADYITPMYKATRQDFYKEAIDSHVYVMWSSSEVYPISLVEATLLGCVPQIHKEQWTDMAFDDWDDPLFWFTDESELITNIRWISENWEEAKKRTEALVAKIRPKLIESEFSKAILSDLQAKYDGDYYTKPQFMGMKKEFEEFLLRVAVKGETVNPLITVGLFNDFIGITMSKSSIVRASTKKLPTDYMFWYWCKYYYKLTDDCSKARVQFDPRSNKDIYNVAETDPKAKKGKQG